MSYLTLYVADDCSLCDTALALLAAARLPDFNSVYIDADPSLVAIYGSRVPVLQDMRDSVELDWPFDLTALAAFVRRSAG